MQLRLVYSTFTHRITLDSGGAPYSETNIDDRRFPNEARIMPLHTPAAVLTSVGGSDAQLAAILSVLGGQWTSEITPYPDPFPGLIGTGLMPDGNQFIEFDLAALIDRTFDEWQWYVDNDPTSPDLPAGFNAGWMARRADVHAFKNDGANTLVRIQTTQHDLYSGELNWDLGFDPEGALLYSYGFPSIVEVWVFDMGTEALLANDTGLSTSVIPNPVEATKPSHFDIYEIVLGGSVAQRFWTNFKACVEDV